MADLLMNSKETVSFPELPDNLIIPISEDVIKPDLKEESLCFENPLCFTTTTTATLTVVALPLPLPILTLPISMDSMNALFSGTDECQLALNDERKDETVSDMNTTKTVNLFDSLPNLTLTPDLKRKRTSLDESRFLGMQQVELSCPNFEWEESLVPLPKTCTIGSLVGPAERTIFEKRMLIAEKLSQKTYENYIGKEDADDEERYYLGVRM